MCFPEGGRTLFASGSANDLGKGKEIEGRTSWNPVIKRKGKKFWGEAETGSTIWLEEQHFLPYPDSFSFGSVQLAVTSQGVDEAVERTSG